MGDSSALTATAAAAAVQVRCRLTGHEMPPQLADAEAYLAGRAYKRVVRGKALAAYDFAQHSPHIMPHRCGRPLVPRM
jgi:hypothetical protein